MELKYTLGALRPVTGEDKISHCAICQRQTFSAELRDELPVLCTHCIVQLPVDAS